MPKFTAVFLNCHNLFSENGPQGRAPTSTAEVEDKLSALVLTVLDAGGGSAPELLGLCELGDRDLAVQLLEQIAPAFYTLVWSPALPAVADPADQQTDLLLAVHTATFAIIRQHPAELLPYVRRPRYHWLAVELQLRSTGRTLWTIVNHWPSDVGHGAERATWARIRLGRGIGEFVQDTAQLTTAEVLLVGDFNAGPADLAVAGNGPLAGTRLVGVREHGRALSSRTTLPYFYNPMWRVVGEVEAWAAPTDPANERSRGPAARHLFRNPREPGGRVGVPGPVPDQPTAHDWRGGTDD